MKKILIIKFAAIGDVLRTTPLLPALRQKYPDARIWWLTQDTSYEVLFYNPLIDRVILYDRHNLNRLKKMHFDLLINLDKDKNAIYSAIQIPATIKKGFGQDKKGELMPFDKDSDYAYRLGIDNELKFRKNKKTYQEISFRQAGLKYNNQKYVFKLAKKDIDYINKKLKSKGLNKKSLKVGTVTGAGKAFAGKKLPFNSYVEIIKGLLHYNNVQVVLLGGPREKNTNKKLIRIFGDLIIDSSTNNTINQFAAIINNCDIIITGDTLTMHLAIALDKYVIVFFGSTASQEIELYKKGHKIQPNIKCSPCYKRKCPINEKCMQMITPDEIVKATKKVMMKIFNQKPSRKFLFLDRDGVINKNPVYLDYIKKPKEFKFLAGALKAIKLVYDAGFSVSIISNQGGIGKGLFTGSDLKNIDKKMLKGIKKAGAGLYRICYCIHHPDHGCPCRKPKTGLIKKAVKGVKVDKKNSFFIGDTERDTVVGKKFGIKTIAVLSGYNNRKDIKKWSEKPDYIAKDLYDAVKNIVLKLETT